MFLYFHLPAPPHCLMLGKEREVFSDYAYVYT